MDATRPICRTADGLPPRSVSFSNLAPALEIRDIVESVWTFSAGSHRLTDYVPPDLASEIICRIDNAPMVLIRGPQVKLGEIAIPSGARYVGARLRPGVASWLLTVAAKDLCGSRIVPDPADLIDTELFVAGVRNPADVVTRVVHTLTGKWRRRGSVAPTTVATKAVDLILRRHGKISADGLASALGCSVRHLRRVMNAEIGMGPKTATRIARVRRAFSLLGVLGEPLAQVALIAGYGDQAHMTREFALLKAPSPAKIRHWYESDFANISEPAPA